MDSATLKRIVHFGALDPYSANAFMKRIYQKSGIQHEEFELCPELENAIPCMLLQSEKIPPRSVLIYLDKGEEIDQEFFPFKAIMEKGLAILKVAMKIGTRPPADQGVVRIWRAVSYLSLRNDLISGKRIFCYAHGQAVIFGLCATILDDRICGLIIDEVPCKAVLPTSKPVSEENGINERKETIELSVPQLGALVAPRPLAILNPAGLEKRGYGKEELRALFKETETSYKKMNSLARFRLGRAGTENLTDLIEWLISVKQ